jgi:diguanylate cyclase (GGDEF)-like protein
MQAFPAQDVNAHVQAEILDGRDSFRLVKIRLALTLIAVAILPFAAIAPIARAVLDDSRTALEQRLAADADHAAAEVRRELTGIGDTVGKLAASAAVAAAAAAPAGDPAAAPAVAELNRLLDRPSGVVDAVAIAGPSEIHARVGADTVPLSGVPPLASGVEYHLAPSGGSTPALELVAAIPGAAGAPPLAWVVASVRLEALVAWASPSAASAGRSVELVDSNGQAVVSVGPRADVDLPGTVIDMAANGAEASQGVAPVGLAAFSDWRIVATAPLPVSALPLPVVVALVGVILLLVAFTWWMARQILRPAAELESQRARLHDLYETAREAALRDSLTGLGNHRAFQEAVTRMVDQSRRYGLTFSLILFDIDEFKRINDTRGHATGDELLAEVGNLIRATVRQADAGYRIGGDEFAILLPSTDSGGAEIMARRLLSRGLEDRPGSTYRGLISFSAGITACPEFGTTRVEVTAQADAALYRGKRAGRTVVTTFDPKIDRGHVDEGMRAELSAAISVVIETGALSPVYQPIVHLATGAILGYEGLVRVRPDAGFAHTGALFDAAEVAGRVLDLDRAALDVVLRGAHEIPHDTLLSLNVSPRSFEAPEFNATVFLAILRRHGVTPDRVLLELTERDAIGDPDRLRVAILALQEAGVRVAADDVGAGNAGLRLLSQFRFDVVKIDLSLVQGGASQDQTLSVLTSLVQLARRFGALTIAEGVETAAQLQMIRQMDIDAGQGYLLGRPGEVLTVDRVDIEAMGGGPAPNGSPSFTMPRSQPAASGPAKPVLVSAAAGAPIGWGSSAPIATPAVAPTAASIIAGGAPNPFGSRPH